MKLAWLRTGVRMTEFSLWIWAVSCPAPVLPVSGHPAPSSPRANSGSSGSPCRQHEDHFPAEPSACFTRPRRGRILGQCAYLRHDLCDGLGGAGRTGRVLVPVDQRHGRDEPPFSQDGQPVPSSVIPSSLSSDGLGGGLRWSPPAPLTAGLYMTHNLRHD